ncbi:MAG: glutamine--fructose-6-phosphate transaminase (isomerizing) [Clostridia bacterium]|nr:glutamine--fructose-6-phosphate transaminase (isomerizing) [Clostridia bacterium]
MCGIVGFTAKENVAEFLLDGLSKLEYRGYDSAGIAVLKDNKINIQKTVKRISDLIEKTENGKNAEGKTGIGHTRWATHGSPCHENAHPHTSENGKFAVVHNGIIENYAELRKELISDGVTFKSETDTEVVPHLLNKYYNGNLREAVKKTEERLEGSYALGIICTDYPEVITAVKNFSPLIIGVSAEGNMIASDVTAVISKTKDIIYLEDGDTAFLTPEGIEVLGEDGKTAERAVKTVNWDISAAEKGGFDHFMLKEIAEQPRAVAQTVESRVKDGEIVFEGITLDEAKLKTIKNINIVACGSAYHAGMVGKYVFEEMLRIPTNVDIASEFRYRNPIVDDKTLTVIISQSGETADTLAALKEAKNRGSHILSIVNVVGSSIAKASDDVIYTWAGPEIAVATTKGFTTQLSVLYMFAIWAAKKLNTMEKCEVDKILDALLTLPEKIESIVAQKEKIANLAKGCGDPESLFFIGRNMDYAVSLEASLKLKEISYIHSEAYAAGELKHGTISLIEEGRTVVALACCKAFFDKMMSNIKEVKARGAYVLACTNEGDERIEAEAEQVIYVPEIHPMLTAAVEVIPFQIYAYYVALYKGCDIDKPRNLAKSVTVE